MMQAFVYLCHGNQEVYSSRHDPSQSKSARSQNDTPERTINDVVESQQMAVMKIKKPRERAREPEMKYAVIMRE